jgi:hypothetical protein
VPGFSHLILDGKIIPCDRCKEPAVSVRGQVIDLWYSGKAHAHGGNVQAVLAPDGFPLWVSQVEPGSVHDITAARAHALPALYPAAAAGLPALTDPGYEGAGIGILIPVKQPPGGRERARLHHMNFVEITSMRVAFYPKDSVERHSHRIYCVSSTRPANPAHLTR